MKIRRKFRPTQVIALGFVALVLLGAFLLSLPISSKSGQWTNFADALFTSTSAGCVTGLVVFDTYQYWSLFGQIVILCLIQIGGLGFVSFAISLFVLLNKRIGLQNRYLMQEAVSAPQIGGIVHLTNFILWGTFLVEGIGALLLSFVFVPRFGWAEGIWFSVFHSVSAFCNAGFDLMGAAGSAFASMTDYVGDIYLGCVLMLLIVLGGLGFVVWHDLTQKGFQIRRYTLQTKIVLSVTALLILLPAVFFFFMEGERSMAGQDVKTRIVASFFQSVTARTAGFSTVDAALMSDASLLVMCLLMFVGGSPGSTAGGLKTTTFAVLLLSTVSFVRRKDSVSVFGRRIDPLIVRRSMTLMLTLFLCLVVSMLVLMVADGVPLPDALFESVSAIATVGITTGITPGLTLCSKMALMVCMFVGRVGCLTLLFSLQGKHVAKTGQLPLENIPVG